MNKYLAYIATIVGVVTLVAWTVSQFIQPVLPDSIDSNLIFVVGVMLATLGAIASLKDAIEFFQLWDNKRDISAIEKNKITEVALNHSPTVLHNLPQPDYEHFIGRKNDFEQTIRLLSPESRHFVVSIDGIGGVGKSALALEVASSFLRGTGSTSREEAFAAIIWSSAKRTVLSGEGPRNRPQALHTIDDIYTAIAVTLGRKDITQAKPEDQQTLVRQALTQQRTLLIVDNLETVDDDRIIAFIQEVPRPTKVIVTTRHRLDIAYPIRLKGMSEQDALELISDETRQREFSLTSYEAGQLYTRTGGVPLAIVWSIAQVGFGYSIDNVLTRLGDPSNDVARFCFEGAIELIETNSALIVLLSLALFSVDASRSALGAVSDLRELDRDEGIVALEKLSLINKSGGRFHMLPLTLSYSRAELTKRSDIDHKLRERWLKYYLSFLDSHGQKYESLSVIESEILNILELLDWCLTAKRHEEFIAILKRINFYLWATGNWNAWNTYLLLGPSIASHMGSELTQGELLGWLASMRYYQDSLVEAKEYALEAIQLYEKLNEKSELALMIRRLASIEIKSGEKLSARANLEKALTLAQEVGNKRYISRIQRQLAKMDMSDGALSKAEERLNQAKSFREEETSVSSGLAYTYRLLGEVSFLKKDYKSSRENFQRNLEIGKAISSQPDVAEAKQGLARLAFIAGKYDEAQRLAREAIEVYSKLRMQRELLESQRLVKQAEEAQLSR